MSYDIVVDVDKSPNPRYRTLYPKPGGGGGGRAGGSRTLGYGSYGSYGSQAGRGGGAGGGAGGGDFEGRGCVSCGHGSGGSGGGFAPHSFAHDHSPSRLSKTSGYSGVQRAWQASDEFGIVLPDVNDAQGTFMHMQQLRERLKQVSLLRVRVGALTRTRTRTRTRARARA